MNEITMEAIEADRAAMSNTDDADVRTVLLAVLGCAQSWVGDARIIGNVRASDIVRAISATLPVAGDGKVKALELLDPADNEAIAWVEENLCATRRDNGSLEYGLKAVVRAYQAGKASASSPDKNGRQEVEWAAWQQFLAELETWCCELPDRTSPEDAPEMMLFDRYELHMLVDKVREFLDAPVSMDPALSLLLKARFQLRDSDFGRYIAPMMPFGCDMIVVFANPAGHLPVWLGLPHQLYINTARELLEKHGGTHLTVVPYRNADKFDVELAALVEPLRASKSEAPTDV